VSQQAGELIPAVHADHRGQFAGRWRVTVERRQHTDDGAGLRRQVRQRSVQQGREGQWRHRMSHTHHNCRPNALLAASGRGASEPVPQGGCTTCAAHAPD